MRVRLEQGERYARGGRDDHWREFEHAVHGRHAVLAPVVNRVHADTQWAYARYLIPLPIGQTSIANLLSMHCELCIVSRLGAQLLAHLLCISYESRIYSLRIADSIQAIFVRQWELSSY